VDWEAVTLSYSHEECSMARKSAGVFGREKRQTERGLVRAW